MPEIRFGVQDAQHSSRPLSAQQMINCYLSETTPGSRSQAAVISSYGINTVTSLQNLKGAGVINGALFTVDEANLYKVTAAGDSITLGAITTIGSDALILGDTLNVIIVTDDKAYTYDGGAIAEIADTDFPVPQWMGFLDGYYPTIEKGTGKIYINETTYSLTNWNPLDFKTAEGSPDNLVWGLVDKRELYLFGIDSTEIWYNSGNADFPLTRTPNGFIERGIMSKYAAAKIDEAVYMMGDDGIAYQIAGYALARISNTFIERQIEKHTKDCRCLTWKESGHTMVAFNFPEYCHVYDATTKLWHRRQSYGYDNWNIKFTQLAHNRYYAGGPKIGYLYQDTFTEFGNILRMLCTSASVNSRKHKMVHGLLELNFDAGHNGNVMLRYSDDGGYTFGKEKWRTLGDTGKYSTRVRFNALGASRDRVYEFSISDPYRRVLLNAYLNEYG